MTYKYLCKINKYSSDLSRLCKYNYCKCYHVCKFNNKNIRIENEKRFFDSIPSMQYKKHLFHKEDFKV